MKKTLLFLMATSLPFISSGRDWTVEDTITYSQHTLYNAAFNNFLSTECPEPTNIINTASTANSATFSWLASDQSSLILYDYYISTPNDSPNSTTTPTGTTSDTIITIESLNHSNQYRFWLRANCGVEDGVSSWVGPLLFNTSQIPATLNFNEDFEGQIDWTFSNGTQPNKWVVGTATSSNSTRSLYISNDSGATNSYAYAGTISVTHAYRELQMPDIVDQIALSFDWKGYGESTFDYMRVWLVPTTFTPVPGTQITAGAGRVQIGANYNQQATWKNEFFILQAAQYQGQIVRVVFEWRNDGSVFNQPPAAVDNVVFNMLTCSSPINLVSSATPGSLQVNLAWTPVGIENQWEIIIQPLGSDLPSLNAIGNIVNDASFTFLANSDELYEFYVRAICSEEDKSQWSIVEYFSIFNPPGCASIDVVGADTTVYNASIYSCPAQDTEVNLSSSFFGIAATTSYEVESIDYAPPFPFVGGEVLSVTTDDRYSPVVDLPFNFCFFGDSYTKAKVGSNGVVVFGNDELVGEDECPWPFSGQIPNAAFPIKNAIYGVYQDTHPTPTSGIINYQVLGTYPCRALVVNFYELPQYSCGASAGLQTSQIVVYEISNIIEVYIGNRNPCVVWQDGVGVVGIQNNVGTQAYVPPGRNTGAWSAQNEAWRFTPNGSSTFDFQWLVEGQFLSDQEEVTLSLTPAQIVELQANGYYTLTVTAEATYDTCGIAAAPITTSRDIDVTFIYSYPDNEPINLVDNAVAGNMEFDLTINDLVMLQGANNPSIYKTNYYNSLADAESGDLILAITNPEAYIGQNNEIIWVNVSDVANCGAGIPKSFSLFYEGLEDCMTLQIEAPTPLVICDENHNGFADFDLTIRNSQILNGLNPTDYTIIFYPTEFDASAGTNAISNPTNYTNIVANQDSVWVRITDTYTGCFAIKELVLILEEGAVIPIATSLHILFVGQTIADIEIIGNNLTWYTDLALTNEIDDSTVLTQGVHTFYVTASIGNCTSNAIEIIIEVALSTNNFDAESFKVYPNPVKDFLNISYNKDIQNIIIVNMLGQSLFTGVVNSTETKVDMEQLPTGSYLVKVIVDGVVNTIKVIKQ